MSDGKGELILYRTEDGRTDIQLRAADGTVWLSQAEIALLFDTTKQNVSLHIRNILAEDELTAEATNKESLTVQTEGQRQVSRPRADRRARRPGSRQYGADQPAGRAHPQGRRGGFQKLSAGG